MRRAAGGLVARAACGGGGGTLDRTARLADLHVSIDVEDTLGYANSSPEGIFAFVSVRNAPELGPSFGGTYRGAPMTVVSDGGGSLGPTLQVTGPGDPDNDVIEVHDDSATITATFAAGTFEPRIVTVRDPAPGHYSVGDTIHIGWSPVRDLGAAAAPRLELWRSQSCGSPSPHSPECPPPARILALDGTVSAPDELSFVVTEPAANDTVDGMAFYSPGLVSEDAVTCEGADTCTSRFHNWQRLMMVVCRSGTPPPCTL